MGLLVGDEKAQVLKDYTSIRGSSVIATRRRLVGWILTAAAADRSGCPDAQRVGDGGG